MDSSNNYYYIVYRGKLAFIKPHHAVRCEEIYSQDFLMPSHIRGLQDEHEVNIVVPIRNIFIYSDFKK